ncbi:MAG: hypothetical protein ABIM73_06540 [Arenimonas sp.]
MKMLLALALSIALSACTGMKTQQQQINAACVSITGANQALTIAVNADKLGAAQQAAVLKALDVTDPVCSVTPKPTLDAVKRAAFDRAIDELRRRLSL